MQIIPPPESRSQYYSYKNFYSIILMALVNANYEFTYADTGKNERTSFGGVLKHTAVYQQLIQSLSNLPNNEETTENVNYIFIGYEPFPLHKHVLTPFPDRDLNHHRRLYNYRISRAINIVENTLGPTASSFRILHTSTSIGISKLFMLFSQYVHYIIICKEAVHCILLGHLLIKKIWRFMKLSHVIGGKKTIS
jgi:hypothetical protein